MVFLWPSRVVFRGKNDDLLESYYHAQMWPHASQPGWSQQGTRAPCIGPRSAGSPCRVCDPESLLPYHVCPSHVNAPKTHDLACCLSSGLIASLICLSLNQISDLDFLRHPLTSSAYQTPNRRKECGEKHSSHCSFPSKGQKWPCFSAAKALLWERIDLGLVPIPSWEGSNVHLCFPEKIPTKMMGCWGEKWSVRTFLIGAEAFGHTKLQPKMEDKEEPMIQQ